MIASIKFQKERWRTRRELKSTKTKRKQSVGEKAETSNKKPKYEENLINYTLYNDISHSSFYLVYVIKNDCSITFGLCSK
jgi:hypothetical protein